MKRLIYILLIIAACTPFYGELVSCGTTSDISTPPISLPTPVTGNISVSSADESGNISVIGEDASVSGGATVMAINSTVAAFNIFERGLELFVHSAYATAAGYPTICYNTGRECVTADANGAFELSIAGSDGDSIDIVLIDSTSGDERSPRLTREAPRGFAPFPGQPVDIAVNGSVGELYILVRGGYTQSGATVSNRIRRMTLSSGAITGNPVEVGGTSATRLAVSASGAAVPDITTAINQIYVSPLDNAGAVTTFTAVTLNNTTLGTGYIVPKDTVALSNSGIIMMASDTSSPSFSLYNFGTGSQMELTVPLDRGLTHVGTDNLDINSYINPDTEEVLPLIAFTSRVSNGAVTTNMLGVYNEDQIKACVEQGICNIPSPIATAWMPVGANITGVALIQDTGVILATDDANNEILVYRLSPSTSGYVISRLGRITLTDFANPKRIRTINVRNTGCVAIVALENRSDTRMDTILALTSDFVPDTAGNFTVRTKFFPVGLKPRGIAYDAVNNFLYISNIGSRNVTRLAIADVLP